MHARTAVLFDLDGVLVDSRAAITGCMNEALVANGLGRRTPESLERFIGPPLAGEFAELTDREESDPIVAACITTYRERYATESLRLTVAVPGIDSALRDRDNLHDLAVAT